MKKSLIILTAAFAAALVSISCNKEQPSPDSAGPAKPVVITASMPEDATKVAGSYDGTKLVLTWEETDAITVTDAADESKAVVFSYVSGAGTKTARFAAADASALEGATSYNVIYNSLPGSFSPQTQAADGDSGHVKYSVSLSGVDSYRDVSFTTSWASAHSGALVQSGALHLHATLPAGVAAVVNSVSLQAGPFSADIALSSQTDAGSDNALDVFATLPAVDVVIPAGIELFVTFSTTDASHSVYTRYYKLPSALMLKTGRLNLITLTCTGTDKYAGKDDDGTSEKPYLIADKYQMMAMHSLLEAGETKHFKMVADVDLKGLSWESLNNADTYSKGMVFDGGNHTISNLTSSEGSYPSFAGVVNGTIKDVVFDGAAITAGANTSGVLAGYVGSSGSSVTANISGITVKNSSITGATKARVGGIAGYLNNVGSKVTGCHVINTKVESTSEKVGGMFGEMGAFTVEGCSAESITVSGTSSVGGLVGVLNGGTLKENTTSGSVSNTIFYPGGLVGRMLSGTVTACSSSATITNSRNNYAHAGGLIGTIEGGSVEKSHAGGNISAIASTVGGLVGSITAGTVSISKCYASGNVTETNATQTKLNYGGLVGKIDGTSVVTITDCYSTGSVSAAKYSGGFIGGIGADASATVKNGYTTSAVSGAKWNCCVFMGALDGTLTSCTGFVGWNTSSRAAWYYNQTTAPTGNYMGTDDSVYKQAAALGGWDFENVWTTDAEPKLR